MACVGMVRHSALRPVFRRCVKLTYLPGSIPHGHRHPQKVRCYHGSSKGSDITAYRVDMRSDTLTVPSQKMRQAMADAAVGDDVYGEDPTVNELQRKMAQLFGKESALFVPTGTMGNLICVMAHCNGRGLETLLGDKSHIHLYEQGGISQVGGVHPRTLKNNADGTFDLDELRDYVRQDDPHYPETRLVCLENTHNYRGGKVLPLEFISKVREVADEHSLGVHMDGARLMNAAVALGVSPAEVLRDVDTVSMCFSKGLGAPVGSIVAGSKEFMRKALRLRKALGGGMRQVGVLAAAAMVGVEDAVDRLTLDHQHAKQIANAFNEYGRDVAAVDIEGVHSNIVMVQVQKDGLDAAELCARLDMVTDEELSATKDRVTVSTLPFAQKTVRIVTHCNISQDDVQLAITKIKYVLQEFAANKPH